MPTYRFFLKESSGRIIGVHLLDCEGDDEISQVAKRLLNAEDRHIRSIEAWDGPRHVLELRREDLSR